MEWLFNRVFNSEDSISIIVAAFAILVVLICMIIFIKTYRGRKIEFFKDEILLRAYRKSHPYLEIDKKLALKNAEEQLGHFFDAPYFELLKRIDLLTSDGRIQYAQLDRASDMICYLFLKENIEKSPSSQQKTFDLPDL